MPIFDTPIGTGSLALLLVALLIACGFEFVSELDSKVSRDRAKSLADRLEAYGVHAAVIEGLGDQMPVASNDTPAGRDHNRRVEVWVRQGAE